MIRIFSLPVRRRSRASCLSKPAREHDARAAQGVQSARRFRSSAGQVLLCPHARSERRRADVGAEYIGELSIR